MDIDKEIDEMQIDSDMVDIHICYGTKMLTTTPRQIKKLILEILNKVVPDEAEQEDHLFIESIRENKREILKKLEK